MILQVVIQGIAVDGDGMWPCVRPLLVAIVVANDDKVVVAMVGAPAAALCAVRRRRGE